MGSPPPASSLASCWSWPCSPPSAYSGSPPQVSPNRRLRPQVAALLGTADATYSTRQIGYDPRRLAREGLITRVNGEVCYTLPPHGRRVTLFSIRRYARVLRPGFPALYPRIASQASPPHRTALTAVDVATDRLLQEAQLVAEKLRRVHAEHAPTRQLVAPELPTKLA